ncbi:MAG: death-on-curing protein [Anaerolineaceae bacterium]|nr:type II toxin-antitoxin system death-on-curing family toxin [Anaerolineae bacterium]MBL1172470.1 type II toxin-antitoxin system death-on-curing family toxin [Chloroflexota bacterium]MBW7919907.1 type II toxin-antitoxin system death-on-curing family toxin [Anaerolineales bacterium]MDL1925092.1 type II toxin-antitoxin system death-on-curing family toxin [Anaerolineae bacterium AMX1]GJQ38700.1 MAG: death-on-curing protein [Anaerolineaceae bacterium]
MRYLTVGEVMEIYSRVMTQSGGSVGILDLGALESAVAQPRMTFNGKELYPTIFEKASALGFSLIQNHPFVDGNKRTGHAAMETFLMLNGYEISASVDEQVDIILGVASGKIDRNAFTDWLRNHIVELL